MPKADEIERKWYVIDAADKPLGRVAAEAATLLRGKHKPIFAPHVDCGDFVIIINTDKAVLTGDKLNKKLYQHHPGYIGNLKEVKYATLMAEKSDFAMELAIKGRRKPPRKQGKRRRLWQGTRRAFVSPLPRCSYSLWYRRGFLPAGLCFLA